MVRANNLMSSEDSRGSVRALPTSRPTPCGEASEQTSPKQQMLQELARLTAAVEADFITGLDILSGTSLGEPTRRIALGSFTNDPLDTLILGLHSLYRQAFELKQHQLAQQAQLAAAMRQSNGF